MYLKDENAIWIATGESPIYLIPKMANRHGLIAGATGTGKTVTLKVMAEAFSDMGVPVFLADIKGDVSGMCKPGESNKHVDERIQQMNLKDFSFSGYPVRFFDVFGKKGIPVRATISDMGPELLARIMQLNDTQAGILNIVFKVADDNKLLLRDLKDLKAMLQYVGDHHDEFITSYGNVSPQSIGAIQRQMLALETSGGDIFFGEPELDLNDWIQTDSAGRGYINLLNCVELVSNPLLYSTFLLWLLSDIYEMLPEVGDADKPKMIFFFDEAHLLFNDAPKALLQKVEQIARLIRSKGVGVYFITQAPSDIPDNVLSQLGNKVQHALRAYTPKDQKAVKAAAASFRANPAFDSETVLGELGTGEALVSFLDEKGVPGIVQRAFILPPRSFLGVAEDDLVNKNITSCPLYSKYSQTIDSESAYEVLQKNAQAAEQAKQQEALAQEQQKEIERLQKEKEKLQNSKRSSGRAKSSPLDKALGAAMSTIGREVGRDILRGILGNIKR